MKQLGFFGLGFAVLEGDLTPHADHGLGQGCLIGGCGIYQVLHHWYNFLEGFRLYKVVPFPEGGH